MNFRLLNLLGCVSIEGALVILVRGILSAGDPKRKPSFSDCYVVDMIYSPHLRSLSGLALREVLVEWFDAVDSGDPWGLVEPRPRCMRSVSRLSSKRLPKPFPGIVKF